MTDIPAITWDTVLGEDLHHHVGRLGMFRRGRLYEILAVGPIGDNGWREVTVPAPPADPPADPVTIAVADDEEVTVRDAPQSPPARTYLSRRGHRIVVPPRNDPQIPQPPPA